MDVVLTFLLLFESNTFIPELRNLPFLMLKDKASEDILFSKTRKKFNYRKK